MDEQDKTLVWVVIGVLLLLLALIGSSVYTTKLKLETAVALVDAGVPALEAAFVVEGRR